jgi:hypothetical protein
MVIPAGSSWAQGHIDPWWEDYQDLPYVNEQFNDDVALAEWRALGYTQTRFTGDMYDMRNAEPTWIDDFRKIFPWQYFSWSIYRMSPGTVLPNHSDTYARFQHVYGIEDIETISRAVVYLEDWQSGHYAEVAGVPIVDWLAGDYIAWRGTTLHLAANNGKTHRYTLQITGVACS